MNDLIDRIVDVVYQTLPLRPAPGDMEAAIRRNVPELAEAAANAAAIQRIREAIDGEACPVAYRIRHLLNGDAK